MFDDAGELVEGVVEVLGGDDQGRRQPDRLAVDVKFQCWAFTVEYISRDPGSDEVRFAVNLLGMGGPIGTGVGVGATRTRER